MHILQLPIQPAPVPPCTTPSFSTTTLPSGSACAWFTLDLTDGDDLFDLDDDDDVVRTLALLLDVVLAVVTALHTDPAFFFFMLPSIVGC